ncbi:MULTISPECIES: HIT family protein [unclassified Streptomyces]|uniref:HIT family protein n=1 Tax=unclassified Streptomyces TaxID=2593676 RepID=UPI00343E6447
MTQTAAPGNGDEPCVFCAIVEGRSPATVVAEWPDAIAIVPLGPRGPLHRLVIPRIHVRDALENPDVNEATVRRATELARAQGGDCHLIANVGPDAEQTVFHLHWHVVGRAADDGLDLWHPAPAEPKNQEAK